MRCILVVCAFFLALPNGVLAQTDQDSVWLSQDPSGYPKLGGMTVDPGASEDIYVFLKTGDSLGAVVVPLDFNAAAIDLDTLYVDQTTFPSTWPDTTSPFIDVENDTLVSEIQSFVVAVIRLQNPSPIEPGVHRMAMMTISSSDTAGFVIDSTFWAPSSHLAFCNKEGTLEWSPEWTPLFLCGDTNGDGGLSTADGFQLLNYLGAGPMVSSIWSSNVNGDDALTSADGFHLLNFFGGGPSLTCAPVAVSQEPAGEFERPELHPDIPEAEAGQE
jgi:hypothetical protein